MMPKKTTVKKKDEPKNVGGRPRKEVDLKKVESLCQYHCSAQEIVAHLQIFDHDVSYNTIDRRIRDEFGVPFGEFVKQKHLAYAKPKLRRLQWQNAEGGNTSMLIWLGKQYLGQTDKQENSGESKVNVNITWD